MGRDTNKLMLILGEVNSCANPRGLFILSWPRKKTGKSLRSVQVYGLFGGKKDTNEKDDDKTSKVCLIPCNFFPFPKVFILTKIYL